MSTLKGYNSNPKTLSGIVDVVADTAQVGGITIDNNNINGISNFTASDITCTNLTATTITGGSITYTTATVDDLVVNDSTLIDCDMNLTTGNSYNINSVDVLNATTLGSSVVNSSLTSLGVLTGLTVNGSANIVTGNFDDVNITNNLDVDNEAIIGKLAVNALPSTYPVEVGGDVNLTSGHGYDINGTSVLNATTLGSSVVNSSLTSLGTLVNGCDIASGQAYKVAGANRLTNDTLTTYPR